MSCRVETCDPDRPEILAKEDRDGAEADFGEVSLKAATTLYTKNIMNEPMHELEKYAFPFQINPDNFAPSSSGLTKREFFAAMAMQSLITLPNLQEFGADEIAMTAIKYADALIRELEEPKQ